MNTEQLQRMRQGKGFIAALDQSGGSTPKALLTYGIPSDSYADEESMFELVHKMRTRIIKSPAFSSEHILGAILFEDTMRRSIDGIPTASFLWEQKGVVPFLKIDNGLLEREDGVQLMKPISKLERLLAEACEKGIFGTKMRSVIMEPNQAGIAKVVQQQFEVAKQICTAGLVPIIEPEVDIHSQGRYDSENILLQEISKLLPSLGENDFVMLKLSIPVEDNLYKYLAKDPRVVRVVALSGGYSLIEACEHLRRNSSLIASFSRALTEGLSAKQSDTDFDKALADNIERIYQASIT